MVAARAIATTIPGHRTWTSGVPNCSRSTLLAKAAEVWLALPRALVATLPAISAMDQEARKAIKTASCRISTSLPPTMGRRIIQTVDRIWTCWAIQVRPTISTMEVRLESAEGTTTLPANTSIRLTDRSSLLIWGLQQVDPAVTKRARDPQRAVQEVAQILLPRRAQAMQTRQAVLRRKACPSARIIASWPAIKARNA